MCTVQGSAMQALPAFCMLYALASVLNPPLDEHADRCKFFFGSWFKDRCATNNPAYLIFASRSQNSITPGQSCDCHMYVRRPHFSLWMSEAICNFHLLSMPSN
ncbi:hypothetical protein BDV97DRAFT_140918 [Delphinella strobiligena]|nr:hypothetical protein BDV97DRAFT_140918 [Delphinella strobiligena]